MNSLDLRTRRALALSTLLVSVMTVAGVNPAAWAQITQFSRAADDFLAASPHAESYAFDQFYPGLDPGSGCLVGGADPVALALAGGTLTVSAFNSSGSPTCPIQDGTSFSRASDALLLGGGNLVMEFDPPVTAFYSMFGSVAVGATVSMQLYSGGTLAGVITSAVSGNNVNSFGHGFVSSVPIDRIRFTSTEAGGVAVGAFRFIVTGEPSLGTVHIPGYGGDNGDNVHLDFACVFVRDSDGDGLLDHEETYIYGTDPEIPDTDGDGLTDGQEIALQQFGCPSPLTADSDGNGLSDGYEHGLGLNLCDGDSDDDGLTDALEVNEYDTNPLVKDTDGDGLFDGTEVDMAQGGNCPSPTTADSDGDSLGDADEVALGTSPCNTDTDADLIADNIDDQPTQPGVSSGFIEEDLRDLCGYIGSLPLALFDAPNNNARQGRRNAVCNKLNAAANAVAAGNYQDALDQLQSLSNKLDGNPTPPDWMVDGPEKVTVSEDVELMALLIAYL